MIYYPEIPVSVEGYAPVVEDGSEVMRSDSGKVWVYRNYAKDVVTFELTHPLLSLEEEDDLVAFYTTNKGSQVIFKDPRSGDLFKVIMHGPPSISKMRGGMLADVKMTLSGERYGATPHST